MNPFNTVQIKQEYVSSTPSHSIHVAVSRDKITNISLIKKALSDTIFEIKTVRKNARKRFPHLFESL